MKLSCNAVRARALAATADPLGEVEGLGLDAHLATCGACRAELVGFRYVASLAEVEPPALDEAARARVLRSLAVDSTRTVTVALPIESRTLGLLQLRPLRFALVAAVVALAVAAGWFFRGRTAGSGDEERGEIAGSADGRGRPEPRPLPVPRTSPAPVRPAAAPAGGPPAPVVGPSAPASAIVPPVPAPHDDAADEPPAAALEDDAADGAVRTPPAKPAARASLPRPDEALGRARALLTERRIDGARDILRELLARKLPKAKAADAALLMADSYRLEGKATEALGHYRSVASRFSGLRAGDVALYAAAQIECEVGDRSRCAAALADYLTRKPKGAFAAEARAKLERHDEK